jgi:hypothetical protein
VTETERKLDLLLGDALAENERLKRELKLDLLLEHRQSLAENESLKYEIKRQEIVIAQLLLAMHEGGTLRVRDDAS